MTEEQIKRTSIPESWAWTTIESIAKTEKGSIKMGPFGSQLKKTELVEKGIRVLWIENVVNDKFEYKEGKFITEEKYEKLKGFAVAPGDLLITMMGTIGKVAAVPNDIAKAIFSSHLLRIRVDNQLCNLEYIKYALLSENSKKQMTKESRGVVMKGLNTKIIKSLIIPLPPLSEQHRIILKIEALFSFLDAGVESLRKVQVQLKRYRQAVLKYAFEGKLTEEWRKTHKDHIEPAQKILEPIKQDKKGISPEHDADGLPPIVTLKLPKLPKEWTWVSLAGCCDVVSGYAFKSKDFIQSFEIPVIKIGNIGYSEFLWQDQEYLPQSFLKDFSKYTVNPDAILMALTRPITNDTLKVCVYPRSAESGLLNQRVAMINIIRHLSKKVLFLYMQSLIFKMQVSDGMSQTLQPNLSPFMLERFVVPLFSSLEQDKIVDEIESRLSVVDKISEIVEQSFRQAVFLRQSILRNAFSGKLVPQDPSDESAENLLERIKAERAKSNGEKDTNKGKKNKPKQLELPNCAK